MNKTPFKLFLILMLIVFACSKPEDTGKESKTSKGSSSRVITKGEVKTEEEVEQGTSESSASNYEEKNRSPRVTSIKIVYISDNNPRSGLRAVAEARDLDGDEISLRYQWKRNGEDIVGATEEVLPWQEDFKKGDKISVEVIPSDGKEEGVWRAEGELVIPNSPPKIISEPEAKMEGGKFIYTVKAEDPDGDPIEFTLKGAPKGMTIEPATGIITWNFDEKDAGEHRIEIIASDPEGARAVQVVTLTIP